MSQYSCVKRSRIASSSHENLNYNTTTKLHLFKHAMNPQKCFIFSYRPQTRSNNIWPIPAERRQCCLLFTLELQNSREWIAFPFECCIKTRLLIFSSHFKNLNAAKGRTKLRFLRVSHLAQSSVTAALTRFDLIRQDKCGLADFDWLPQTELRSPNHVLVHSTWWEEQDGEV